jgi:hypothetical protein
LGAFRQRKKIPERHGRHPGIPFLRINLDDFGSSRMLD